MTMLERLMQYVKENKETGCWEWVGAKCSAGYGVVTVRQNRNKSTKSAHRLMWQEKVGPISDGLCVLHKCDNPCCVNPEHLFLGTFADNSADMVAKGRAAKGAKSGRYTHPETNPRGERNGRAKITADDVVEIRRRYKPRVVTTKMLADEYGVSNQLISCILLRQNWKHVA